MPIVDIITLETYVPFCSIFTSQTHIFFSLSTMCVAGCTVCTVYRPAFNLLLTVVPCIHVEKRDTYYHTVRNRNGLLSISRIFTDKEKKIYVFDLIIVMSGTGLLMDERRARIYKCNAKKRSIR